ncbi:class I adenylate-forming enzyme family protein [Paraglaciecola sp. L3A3]|uniref:AMP-binding protein n=1 Tax=Paraglaciecola sp. L3A3 TaxID=2686358 RepID=UPI00131DB013|nr:class I adenylate-forming enzyme family protein [Paraglaciecola sp. L3A3]
MANLMAQLAIESAKGQTFWADKQVSVADLVAKAQQVRLEQPQLCGQKVLLTYRQLEEFLVGLIAFDGWCTEMYLCPPDVTSRPEDGVQGWSFNELTADQITTSAQQNNVDIESQQTLWYIATSGTTGEPKWFAHTFNSLTAQTKHSTNLQTLCWALMYQCFRFAGLQVVLQALLSGADLVDVTAYEPLSQLALMQKNKVTAVSATPSLWRQLLMTKQLSQLSLSHITLGGEIVDQSLLEQLTRLFPQARIRHIYASTEAGVGFVVSDGKAGFPLSWLNNSDLSVALKISDEQHLLVKPKEQSSTLSTIKVDEQGFMDTQDRVEVINDRVLFLGRATGTINVGGNKVHPEKVEQVLLSCEGISQARVYAKKSPLMGELVVADIVLFDNSDMARLDAVSIKRQVINDCKNQLQRFEIPTKITVVEIIDHNLSGKLNRK